MSLATELAELAIAIAQEAGSLAVQRRREGVQIAAHKSAMADIVTVADRDVETLIRSRIAEARPEDAFFGEESGGGVRDIGVTWVVDPIDGTVNYAKGFPQYAVSIAAVTTGPEGMSTLAGVVHAPALGETAHASLGGGAWADDRRLQVSEPDPAGALVSTGFGYDPSTHAGDLESLMSVMPLARDIRRMGSAAIDLASVAAGRCDVYFERGLNLWDYAAGALLVREAGGRFELFEPTAQRPMIIAGSPWIWQRTSDSLGF